MIKSATEAGAIPTFHFMDEVEVDGLLAARALLQGDAALQGEARPARMRGVCGVLCCAVARAVR
jgi:hypothetical protein